ncbi:MAG: HAMP domain-containing histidine kinase [Dehalococcoidia bacterium]|nr:HAMP domain-containing histidine kinase [Dehalococcoidia bacterium]
MLHSFRARLLGGFGIVILITLSFSAVLVALLLRDQQAETAEARIGVLVAPITQIAREKELLGWPDELIRVELSAYADAFDLRVLIMDRRNRVVIDTATGEPLLGQVMELSFTEPILAQGPMEAFRTQRLRVGGDELYLFTVGESSSNSILDRAPLRQVVIAVPAGDVAGAWWQLLPRLGIAGLGAAAVAVVFALLFASRVTVPLRAMTQASEAMAAGDLSQRIDVNGEDEVGRLAEAFNLMSSRVSRGDRSMRDLLANVSHELRTPLTSIQGFSQAIADGVTDDPTEAALLISDEAQRIRLLLDDLLYLSEIESSTVHLNLEEVDLDGLVEGALRRFRFQADEREVELVANSHGGSIQADGRRIEQVLANLVENAIRFAPPRTAVTITTSEVADGVLIDVHNGGAPIPTEDRERVFDRFYQVDRARSPGRHRGLGLSIVHELVQAHHGHVSVDSSEERGTTFSVFLPLSPRATETAG